MTGILAHPIGGGWSLRHDAPTCADTTEGAVPVSNSELEDGGADMSDCDGCGGPLCEPPRDVPPLRRARVRGGCGKVTRDQVAAYLPNNYSASWDAGSIVIEGRDRCGWTLDGYVIPRLASGMIVATEDAS